MLDAVKVSDLEEVSDQDTDNNVVGYEEGFCLLYFKYVYSLKVFINLHTSKWINHKHNKLIFLYLKTRHCKCYTLNIMYIKLI